MTWPVYRGQVIRANINLDEPKRFVVVSNNLRNRNFRSVLAVRLTTTAKPDLPSIVELGHPEVFVGRAVCDDLEVIYQAEVMAVLGALSPKGMDAIDVGLKAALSLP